MTINEETQLLSPKELKEKHPGIIWNNRDIGWLLRLKIVRGKKTDRSCLLSEEDVLEIYKMRK